MSTELGSENKPIQHNTVREKVKSFPLISRQMIFNIWLRMDFFILYLIAEVCPIISVVYHWKKCKGVKGLVMLLKLVTVIIILCMFHVFGCFYFQALSAYSQLVPRLYLLWSLTFSLLFVIILQCGDGDVILLSVLTLVLLSIFDILQNILHCFSMSCK